jgi:hypothetical protein
MADKYEKSVKLMDKNIRFRKWKIKDKKKFLSNKSDSILVKEALVYDCLEDKKISLSNEEYNFLLIQIREASLKEKIEYFFECPSCEKEHKFTADLTKIVSGDFKQYGLLSSGKHEFVMQRILNRDFYEKHMSEQTDKEEMKLIDFILHIKSYNDNDALSFNELNSIINDLDVDVFEDCFKQWEEMRFKLNSFSNVECPNCKTSTEYEFDDFPGFFPSSWDE